VVSDTLVLAERNLVRLPRAPDLLIGFTIQPVMFVLLFAYVFGGAIDTPGFDYIDFLIPGIIVQNIAVRRVRHGARPGRGHEPRA
jgi:ABC-2 type transport system permease protein/oleandomycin transport system permease protein